MLTKHGTGPTFFAARMLGGQRTRVILGDPTRVKVGVGPIRVKIGVVTIKVGIEVGPSMLQEC